MWRMGLKWFGESHIASVRLKRSYRNSDYCIACWGGIEGREE